GTGGGVEEMGRGAGQAAMGRRRGEEAVMHSASRRDRPGGSLYSVYFANEWLLTSLQLLGRSWWPELVLTLSGRINHVAGSLCLTTPHLPACAACPPRPIR